MFYVDFFPVGNGFHAGDAICLRYSADSALGGWGDCWRHKTVWRGAWRPYAPPVPDPATQDPDLVPLFIQILIVRAGSR